MSALVSTAIAVLILTVILLTARQTYGDFKKITLYTGLTHKVFALDILFNDYMLHPEEREIIQWESVYSSLGDILEDIEAGQHVEQEFIAFLKNSYRDVNMLFFQLEPVGMPSANPVISQKRRDLIADQLLIVLDYMVVEASRLVDESQTRIIDSLKETGLLVLFLLVAMAITSVAILLYTGNRIAHSIEELQEGIGVIAAGSFDHKIQEKTDDEIGQLARTFNKMARDLSYSYSALKDEIAQRRLTEEALRLDEARLETLFEMSRITNASEKQITDFALEQELMLTGSQIGLLGLVNDDESALTLHSWSEHVKQECAVRGETTHFPIEEGGLWAEAVRRRKPIIVNDYSEPNPYKRGYPEGHVDMKRLMVVPVFEGSRVVAVAAVGNKKEDYDAADLRQFTLLMDGMWKLLQRERGEIALRDAESLAAMGRALSSVAHDMKTPLIAIGGFARQVQKHLKEDDLNRAKLEIVIKETRRLENMVKDMLDFSRPLDLRRDLDDINQAISESIELVEGTAQEKRVRIENRMPPDMPHCSFDATRMKQVLINLIVNAVQASPEGEVVTVASELSDHGLIIDVIDRGSGIPPESRKTVFSPFFTTKKEGTGLGLPIVKKIVEAHQGKVLIMDNSDAGTTVRVILPGV